MFDGSPDGTAADSGVATDVGPGAAPGSLRAAAVAAACTVETTPALRHGVGCDVDVALGTGFPHWDRSFRPRSPAATRRPDRYRR